MFKFFKIPVPPDDTSGKSPTDSNPLQKYIQSQSMQDMSHIATEISPEVKQLVAMNVQALMGYLPASEFNTTIMSTKESLQNLLASAMLTGYFMHAMEHRMLMDNLFEKDAPNNQEAQPLQAPETLFSSVEESPSEEQLASNSPLTIPENKGRFLSISDLLSQMDAPPEINLHLEINSELDLESFLKEFHSLHPDADNKETD